MEEGVARKLGFGTEKDYVGLAGVQGQTISEGSDVWRRADDTEIQLHVIGVRVELDT